MNRYAASLGAILAFLSVALGAFGAHTLKARISPADLETFKTGANYQLLHGLALFVAGRLHSSKLKGVTCSLLVIGIIVFCGSLYGIALGAPKWLGAVAPVGGICLMTAWVCLAWANWPRSNEEQSAR